MLRPIFIRYGGLSSVAQKGYDASMPSFHSPPVRRGVYAFPWPHVEYFLLGSSVFIPTRMVWVKDKQGNRIGPGHKDYERLGNKSGIFGVLDHPPEKKVAGYYLAKHIRPRKFGYEGELWHHLPISRRAIVREHGSWRLSRFDDYCEALQKQVGVVARQHLVRDHLEVFIEKI